MNGLLAWFKSKDIDQTLHFNVENCIFPSHIIFYKDTYIAQVYSRL